MDYMTTTDQLLDRLTGINDPADPLVRLALDHAQAAWLDNPNPADLRWILFGTTVSAITAGLFPEPATQTVHVSDRTVVPYADLEPALSALVVRLAEIFRTAEHRNPLYAEAARQLDDAAQDLRCPA